MFIKICANTNLEDARLAAQRGADAVGFVFAPSPRRVNVEEAAAITAQLPESMKKIGVFSTLDLDEIATTVQQAHLDGVQLHGGFAEPLVRWLRQHFGQQLQIIQTNSWRVGSQNASAFASELKALSAVPQIDSVLIDSRTMVADGGTGVVFDWEAARDAVRELGDKPLIVAGGLHAGNVSAAIAMLKPWGVDVASGVESAPGRKDPERLRQFIAAAREAERG
jgi:phosphoribosylanthranilate isomerase